LKSRVEAWLAFRPECRCLLGGPSTHDACPPTFLGASVNRQSGSDGIRAKLSRCVDHLIDEILMSVSGRVVDCPRTNCSALTISSILFFLFSPAGYAARRGKFVVVVNSRRDAQGPHPHTRSRPAALSRRSRPCEVLAPEAATSVCTPMSPSNTSPSSCSVGSNMTRIFCFDEVNWQRRAGIAHDANRTRLVANRRDQAITEIRSEGLNVDPTFACSQHHPNACQVCLAITRTLWRRCRPPRA
jgi:hypothetical protein